MGRQISVEIFPGIAPEDILLTSEDYKEAVNSFMEKREGIYKGR